MAVDTRLADKGRSEPLRGLVQQGRVHVALAQQHAVELAESGWFEAQTARLEAMVGQLDTESAARADTVAAARWSTKKEHAAIDDAKAFLRRLRNALPMVLREATAAEVTVKSFAIGRRLRRQTPLITSYLGRIRTPVLALDVALRPHFRGKSAVEELDRVKKNLDDADVVQETSLLNLPAETLKLYELKGRVLELIEDMNRVAKNAFEGQPALAAKFKKDLLLRARRGHRKAQAQSAIEPTAESVGDEGG